MMICRSSDIFYRFRNDQILTKIEAEIEVYENQKLLNKLRQIHYAKDHLLWFMLAHMTVMRTSK